MYTTSRLTDMNYDGTKRLRMDFTGHATDVIDHARRISQEVLGTGGTWIFISIQGQLPENYGLPSDMKWKIVAERTI